MEFTETTEIEERSLRRLAQSRGCTLTRHDTSYTIQGASLAGITLSDDECWAVLSDMPKVQTLSGKNRFYS